MSLRPRCGLAGRASCSASAITKLYELIGAGEIESIKLGRSRLVIYDSLVRLVERSKGAATKWESAARIYQSSRASDWASRRSRTEGEPADRRRVAMVDGNRRTALLSLIGTAVAGAGLAASGCAKGGDGDGEVTANEDLMREHGVLRRILVIYREVAPKLVLNAAAVDAAALGSAAKLFQTFGEHYHEQLLEEQHIFPMVLKTGGDASAIVGTLIAQHARGREITAYILDRTKSGRVQTSDAASMARTLTGFSRMYEPHAAREDTIIFPAFKNAAGKRGYEELGDQFEDIEKREFGGDGFQIALDQVADLERRLGTADLGSFTAPEVSTS
jgi:hemerythrin-like domain-containing protein